MSVVEKVRECKENIDSVKIKLNKKRFVNHLCCIVLGFLFSLAGFGDSFSPFGVAFAGSISPRYTLSATLGAVAGYFISLDSVDALRYTATVLALAVIIYALKPFKQISVSAVTPVVVVFVCLFVTGMAIVFSNGGQAFEFIISFSESIVGCAAAYAFSKVRVILSVKKGFYSATSKEITALVIFATLLLLSINEINIFGVYIARIISVFLIFLCSYYGRESGGAIVGVCTGIAMSLGSGDVMLLALYSLGGLLSGVFSDFGRIATLVSFFFSGIVVSAISYSVETIIPSVVEFIIAGAFFFFLTIKYNYKFEEVFKPSVASPVIESVKTNIISKLQKAAEFSEEICMSLTSVNDALMKNEKQGVDYIPKKTKDQICGSCGLYDTCWDENAEDTKRMFDNLLELKKRGIYLEYKTVPQGFSSGCIRTENVSSSFNKLYSESKMKEKLEGRIREIHTLAAEQFVNMASLLNSVCDDVNEDIRYDMDIAARVKVAALNCNFQPIDSCCTLNQMEKMKVEIKFQVPCDKTNFQRFNTQVGLIAGREMELPEIVETENYIKLIYKEKAELRAVCAGVQYNSNSEKYCGDMYSSFQDDKGYFYGVICDGMGIGPKAAISSSLAVTLLEKLIKAGFSISAAINTVNTSLISKSGDECSVTLDLFCLDLYTGRCEFYKCGAMDTLVKRKGKIVDVGFDSLPLGIINNVDVSCGTGMLSVGDIVVLCSDGVREEDFYTLRNGLKKFKDGNVRNFTTDLCETIRRNQPAKNDDMTMLTIAITTN